eukprot:scaffold8514_cov55-Phaeocystis_antarctica.AAC.4
MVLLSHGDGVAMPKRQELPPVVLPQPIDSTVFLAKQYRPPPLAFLKPFGVHTPRLGAAEEARLPFDPRVARVRAPELSGAPGSSLVLNPSKESPRHSPRRDSPRRAAASHQQAKDGRLMRLEDPPPAAAGSSSRAEVRALASRLEEGLARGGGAVALEELWQGVELELVRQACVHCVERGELMEAVRRRREAHAGVMRRQVAAQRLELQQLRRDVEVLGAQVVELGDALGGDKGDTGAEGAESGSQGQSRVRLYSEAVFYLVLTTDYLLPTAYYYLLLVTCCLLLTAHCSLLTAHCSLLTAHCSLLTAHCSLLTARLRTTF